MKSTKKALLMGTLASLFAASALNAATYYIGAAVGPVAATGGGPNLTGSITAKDTSTSIWDLGGASVTLLAADTIILDNVVFVVNGTVSIEAGAVIRGQPRTSGAIFDPGALCITRSAKILASGLPTNPIIFTTASTAPGLADKFGFRASGATPAFWDNAPHTAPKPLVTAAVAPGTGTIGSTALWGGVMILGNAPTNVDRNLRGVDNGGAAGGAYDDADRVTFFDEQGGLINRDDRSTIEGVPDTSVAGNAGVDRFGGNVALDNSGVLSYVSIRYGGAIISGNSEINGLTLGAVGAGTTIDHIEIFGNSDDGVEVFGGSVNMKFMSVMGVEDDMFDFDAGYSGYAQFLFGVGWHRTGTSSTSAESTDRAIEWDGSYRFENPNGFTSGSATSQPVAGAGPGFVPTGAIGAVTSNQSPVGGNTVLNATFVGNTYPLAEPSFTSDSGFSDNNDRSRGIMIRDQAAATLLNSIIIPRTYGLRVAYIGTEDYTASIRRLETGRAVIANNTFSSPIGSQDTDAEFIGQGFNNGPSINRLVRTDSPVAEVTAVLAGKGNTFNVSPAFTNSLTADLTSGQIDPRPTAGFTGVSLAPEGSGADLVAFRGAFSDDGFSDLWTTGWTAANKLGLIVN